MKSKIGLIAVVLASGLLLSACTNKETNTSISNENWEESQTEEQNARPSGSPDGRGPGQQMDVVKAATKLGVSEEALRAALGINNETEQPDTTPGAKPSGEPKRMDLAAAAKTLGVTEDELKEALGVDNMPTGAERPEGSPPAENN